MLLATDPQECWLSIALKARWGGSHKWGNSSQYPVQIYSHFSHEFHDFSHNLSGLPNWSLCSGSWSLRAHSTSKNVLWSLCHYGNWCANMALSADACRDWQGSLQLLVHCKTCLYVCSIWLTFRVKNITDREKFSGEFFCNYSYRKMEDSIDIYIYTVKLKSGPRFGGFKVKRWSKLKVKKWSKFFFHFFRHF